jgi:signal transduction histidine kinase
MLSLAAQFTEIRAFFLPELSTTSTPHNQSDMSNPRKISGTMHMSHSDRSNLAPHAVYNLRQTFESMCEGVQKHVQAKQISLSTAIAEELPVAYWDINMMRHHVLDNLLSSAIQHTPVGGKIEFSVDKSSNYTVSIRISDSGTGGERASALHDAQLCVTAHKGAISLIDQAALSGVTYKIEIPLYSLCMQ